MSKILKIASKEVSLIKSQKIAVVLVLLYPLIIVAVLVLALGGPAIYGSLLGSSGLDEISLGVYVPEQSLVFDYETFFEKVNDSERLQVLVFSSKEDVKESVRLGESQLGVFIEEPETSGDELRVQIFYDNVSPFASSSLLFFAESKIRELGSQTAKESLYKIWEEMETIETQLFDQRKKIDEFIKKVRESKRDLGRLEHDLASIRLSSIRVKLDSFESYYSQYNVEIDAAKTGISNTNNQLYSYNNELVKARNDLVTYREQLIEIRELVRTAKSNSVEPVTSQLQEIEDKITLEIEKIDSSIETIDRAKQDIGVAQQKLSEAGSTLSGAKSDLKNVQLTVEDFSRVLDDAEETLLEAQSFIEKTSAFQEKILLDSESNKGFLTGLLQRLREFREVSPDVLIQPITIQNAGLFKARTLDTMLVISIVVVLLLTSILLTGVSTILEREQGMAFRVSISPTGKFTWVAGKIIGQMAFVSIISVIILLISFLVFGLPFEGSILALVVALLVIPFSFICLSLFIARFANTFSAIVLASLLLFIPMLLLSGILFPLEFMPNIAAAFSGLLPLTVANNLLLDIVLRGMPLIHVIPEILTLLSYSAIFLGVYLIGKKI